MKQYNHVYISGDVEANGPTLGRHSMLSAGLAAYDIDKNLLGSFSVNIEEIENGEQHPDNMEFWAKNQAAYDATRINMVSPKEAAERMDEWLSNFKYKLFIGFPAVYDFKWIDYYLQTYANSTPFGHSKVIDLKTLAFAMIKPVNFGNAAKRNFPKRWFDNFSHTHIAVDDAIEQGAMGINMIRELQGLPRV